MKDEPFIFRKDNPGVTMAQRFVKPYVEHCEIAINAKEKLDAVKTLALLTEGGRMDKEITAIYECQNGFEFHFKDESFAVLKIDHEGLAVFAARPKGAIYPEAKP